MSEKNIESGKNSDNTEDGIRGKRRREEDTRHVEESSVPKRGRMPSENPINKTPAQYMREWRLKKKELNRDSKQVPKSNAQRSREYRERKKREKENPPANTGELIPLEVILHEGQHDEEPRVEPAMSVSHIVSKQVPKSNAQRAREWRERKKRERGNPPDNRGELIPPEVILPELQHDGEPHVEPTTVRRPQLDIPQSSELSQDLAPRNITPNLREEGTPYTDFQMHQNAHREFRKKFFENAFGSICSICERLWFKSDLTKILESHCELIQPAFPGIDVHQFMGCRTCLQSLKQGKIPTFSTSNGFRYPSVPPHLPALDLVSERLISPRLPFMQIRRLRHMNGQYGIYGQVINVPVDINTMVHSLPRQLSDDHAITVHIKKKKIHKSSYLIGLIQKNTIKIWLQYLCDTPLYQFYNIKVDQSFFNESGVEILPRGEVSEEIPIEDSLTCQQQTMLWNEEKYLRIAPGEKTLPVSLLFDEHAEELSFPSIYLGQFRSFKENVKVTPYIMATSELRRGDRRGVTPQHLLYLAMKIMRLRVRDSLTIAFKHIGTDSNITKEKIESEEYINQCLETNLAFLRCIPNSSWYWAGRKKNLFAMIRQLGKPTIFLTLSANEIGWVNLLKTLYTLKNDGNEISDELVAELSYIQKSSLINEDAVTCAIYFNRLVNVLLTLLQSKKSNPFGEYRVVDYFKRIEFQHRGSPHAHILLWLENAPKDAIGANKGEAIAMIDNLISVSRRESSGNMDLNIHHHTFTCYKSVAAKNSQKCRFDAPFMPCRKTTILIPMDKADPNFGKYSKHYTEIKKNLEDNDYSNLEEFYLANDIESDEHYLNVLRAGITRPRVFLKRQPSEKWHNAFNPFILNVLQSNTDIQFILEEYSCAAYVVEYINKTNRGISNLQRQIVEIMNEHPEFDIVDVTRKMSVDMLNTVEVSSQEAAWYLLREPMSKSSTAVTYIPTVWPVERQRIRKTQEELAKMGLDDDSTDIWKDNWFDKYQKRPEILDEVTLAQFVANWQITGDKCSKRKKPRIIRYRNYDMANDVNEYKREMITLFYPFRDEEIEILAQMKYVKLYDDNENLILQRRREFESDLDLQKTIEICRQLCREEEDEQNDIPVDHLVGRAAEPDPLQAVYNDENAEVNQDLRLASLCKLGAIAKRRENLMPNRDFHDLMRKSNVKQKGLLMHIIHNLLSESRSPFQFFLTGPAGCGKTFVIRLIMEIYNRYTTTDGYCNAYITCASTGKAAVAIDGTTIHTALKISLSKILPLSNEVVQQYRTLFRYVQVIIIDEISMVSAELLSHIDNRLKQITGNYDSHFGKLDVILIGDLRQLPPVRATPIYKQTKQRIAAPTLWQGWKFYELDEVMRQANRDFSNILTKIGNGLELEGNELQLIESRFFVREEADRLCPDGIRLFYSNHAVNEYNQSVLNSVDDKVISHARDIFEGCRGAEQEAFVREKLHKMSVIDTGGLPYEITFVKNKPYMLTTNVDVADGLANGAIGKLAHMELDETGELTRVWMEFPNAKRVGEKTRRKVSAYVQSHNISRTAVPISRRSSTIYLNNNKTIAAKRNHFPIISSCAVTIHKSQGGTFDQVVYDYSKEHPHSLLYVGLSRVTSLNGLYIVNSKDDHKFYHGRRASTSMGTLQAEFNRLSLNKLETITGQMMNFLSDKNNIGIFSLNCQSLRAHAVDLNDQVTQHSTILMLSETWVDVRENVEIPNFDCVVKFKRPNVRAAGVAIYHKSIDRLVAMTPHVAILINQQDAMSLHTSAIGEICAARCRLNNGQLILIAAIYISPNKKIGDIAEFIHETLLSYTRRGAAILNKNWGELPMILTGDFNVNFAKPEAQPLIDFLLDKFELTMNSDRAHSTTRGGTTIDAVFCRNLEKLTSTTYVSYFSYHKPIISILNTE